MDNNTESTHNLHEILNPNSYTVRGKIMFSSIIILFFVVFLMLILHLYARCYLLRTRRRFLRNRSTNRLVFHLDSNYNNTTTARGLDASVIALLPIFTHDPVTNPDNPPDCAVCLSEFQEGETGRVLPKCNHSFHTDCIDMWFHSNSTCPLCRAPVEPTPELLGEPGVVVIDVCEPESGSGSGLEESRTGREVCSSVRRKPSLTVDVMIEIPPRDESGSVCDSPSTSSFRSPMNRVLSLLGRERRGSISPSSGCGGCSSSAAELNAERGGGDENQ